MMRANYSVPAFLSVTFSPVCRWRACRATLRDKLATYSFTFSPAVRFEFVIVAHGAPHCDPIINANHGKKSDLHSTAISRSIGWRCAVRRGGGGLCL